MDPITPNELRAPGERETIARIEAVYEAVDGLSADDLNTAPVPRLDLDARDERLAALEELADGLGRGDLLDEARDTLRDAVLARFMAGLSYPYGLRPVSMARTEDKAAILAALLDLVAVAVVEDLLDPRDAEALREPGRMVLSLVGEPGDVEDGGLRDGGAGWEVESPSAESLAEAGAPTEADWAEAEHGSTAIRPRERSPWEP